MPSEVAEAPREIPSRAETAPRFDVDTTPMPRVDVEESRRADDKYVVKMGFTSSEELLAKGPSDKGTTDATTSDATAGGAPETGARADKPETFKGERTLDESGRITRSEHRKDFLTMSVDYDDATGSRTETHSGPAGAHENFTVRVSKDGTMSVREMGGTTDKTFLENPELSEPRESLLKDAERSITDPHLLSRFKADMVRFENRMASSGLSPADAERQITDTYKHVGRLMQDNPGGPSRFSPEARTALSMQVMHHAASPDSISQRGADTCQVTAGVEMRLYSRMPSKAAEVVADTALDGKFKMPGTPGEPQPKPIEIHGLDKLDAKFSNNPTVANPRTLANEIVQMTAVSALGHRYGLDSTGTEGSIKEGNAVKFRGFNMEDTVSINSLFEPHRPDSFISGLPSKRFGPHEHTHIESREQLTRILESARESNGFPITVGHWASYGPLAVGSGHAISITGFDGREVSIHDQARLRPNLKVSVDDLFKTMRPDIPERKFNDEAIALHSTNPTLENVVELLEKHSGNGHVPTEKMRMLLHGRLPQDAESAAQRPETMERIGKVFGKLSTENQIALGSMLIDKGLVDGKPGSPIADRLREIAKYGSGSPLNHPELVVSLARLGDTSEDLKSAWKEAARETGLKPEDWNHATDRELYDHFDKVRKSDDPMTAISAGRRLDFARSLMRLPEDVKQRLRSW